MQSQKLSLDNIIAATTKITVLFRVLCCTVDKKDFGEIGVCGSISQLGSWDTSKAQVMNRVSEENNTWFEIFLEIAHLQFPIE